MSTGETRKREGGERLATVRIDILKVVAAATMTIDHLNKIWWGGRVTAMEVIGRMAFPLFAFVLAYNLVRHTRRPWRFAGRVLGWGLVAQLFFMYALETNHSNVLFTLGFGLLFAQLFRRGEWRSLGLVIAVGVWIVSRFKEPIGATLDFGIEGVLLVYVFARFVEQPNVLHGLIVVVFTATLNANAELGRTLLYAVGALSALLAIWLCGNMPGEWRWVRRSGIAFYFFYPAHLFLLRFAFDWVQAGNP